MGIDGEDSVSVPVISGITSSGADHVLVHINDLSTELSSQVRLFADVEDGMVIQNDLDRLSTCTVDSRYLDLAYLE